MSRLAVLLLAQLSFVVGARAEKQKVLLVASGPEEKAVRSELVRRQLSIEDLRRAWGELCSGMGVMAIDELPPTWAPEGLRSDWEQGTAACRAQVGPPPYAGKSKAVFCGMDLKKALWQRHIERIGGEDGVVLLVSVSDTNGGPPWRASATAYLVPENSQRSFEATFPSQETAVRASVEFVGKLLTGEGSPRPRDVVRQLPQAPTGTPTANSQVAEYAAREVPAGCGPRLPKTLELNPKNSSASALESRWARSVQPAGAAGKTESCGFTYESSQGENFGMTIYSAKAALTCGQESIEAKSQGFSPSDVENQVTGKLVDALLGARCR